jgi:hypothetical protein
MAVIRIARIKNRTPVMSLDLGVRLAQKAAKAKIKWKDRSESASVFTPLSEQFLEFP